MTQQLADGLPYIATLSDTHTHIQFVAERSFYLFFFILQFVFHSTLYYMLEFLCLYGSCDGVRQ